MLPPMRQLLLDLMPESPPSLANFVGDGNEEALAALADWFSGPQPLFLLWGEAGSGKSHLLQASGLHFVDGAQDPLLAGQIALFNHFNRLRLAVENGRPGKLLVASDQPPAALQLREDLRTRLGSALIFRLRPLSDEEKLAALAAQAADRGLKLSREALTYLMNRSSRDMRTLAALLAALDRYSLEHKRPITLPLLREVLQHAGDSTV